MTSASFRRENDENYGMIYASLTFKPMGSLPAESGIA